MNRRNDNITEEVNMSGISFQEIFCSKAVARDKFLSRIFGIFSEEIVRIWCKNPKSPYENLGRPVLKNRPDERGWTLDYGLKSREDGRIFVAEQKCELQFQNYQYLKLKSLRQLDHHTGEAFTRFRDFAKTPRQYIVTISGKKVSTEGAILVWGSVEEEFTSELKEKTGIYDILSLEKIVSDLVVWADPEYRLLIRERKKWCQELFNALT